MRDDVAHHLSQPVASAARTDFAVLRPNMTVEGALAHIRQTGIGERIIYFYVTDSDERLVGVVPTRRLLANPLDRPIGELMVPGVLAIPHTATLLDACEMFVLHKFLAFPVVDAERRMVGVIDISFFATQVFQLSDEEKPDQVFEAIGFHIEEVRHVSVIGRFKIRFPWLLGTVASGVTCAFLAGAFEETLAHALTITFFLPLVLGLNESIAMQSMSLSLQSLHGRATHLRLRVRAFRTEFVTLALLGLGSAAVAATVAATWRHSGVAAAVVGMTIVMSMVVSGIIGYFAPLLLRLGRRDPKLAAGPLALAAVDVASLLLYFTLARAAL